MPRLANVIDGNPVRFVYDRGSLPTADSDTSHSVDEQITRRLLQAAESMNRIACVKQSGSANFADLTYHPAPFKKLWQLDDNWDGLGSPKPSATLLGKGEAVWDLIAEYDPVVEKPRVFPAAGDCLVFSWRSSFPEKQLQFSIYEQEDGSFTCDWLLKLGILKDTNEAPMDVTHLLKQLMVYAAG